MRKLLMAGGLLCVMFMGSLAAPAALPSYAGTWVLDEDKGSGAFLAYVRRMRMTHEGMGKIKIIVTQDEKQITVKTLATPPLSYEDSIATYMLDGSKTNGFGLVTWPTSAFSRGQIKVLIKRTIRLRVGNR